MKRLSDADRRFLETCGIDSNAVCAYDGDLAAIRQTKLYELATFAGYCMGSCYGDDHEKTLAVVGAILTGDRELIEHYSAQMELRERRGRQAVDDAPRFGLCPNCHEEPVYRNVKKNVYFCCNVCKVWWPGGYGIFSSWELETEDDWKRNAAWLEAAHRVKPYWPSITGGDAGAGDDADVPF